MSANSFSVPCIVIDDMETLGELIHRRINELNISQAELARRVGVKRSYIGKLANENAATRTGKHMPAPAITRGLARALKVSEIEVLAAIYFSDEDSHDGVDFKLIGGITELIPRSTEWDSLQRKIFMRSVADSARAVSEIADEDRAVRELPTSKIVPANDIKRKVS